MSLESAAYDKPNDDGFPPDPVVVIVATGIYDVSRLVDVLNNGYARCEHAQLAAQVTSQVKRHHAGRAALKLLKLHGGPDLLETVPEDTDQAEEARGE